MSNKSLANKVALNIDFFSVEKIEDIIALHQSQYPGGWQEWDEAKKTKSITALLRKAKAKGETGNGRIVMLDV